MCDSCTDALCIPEYSTTEEILKLVIQWLYLFPIITINFLILWVILIKKRKIYLHLSFYKLLVIDTFSGILSLLIAALFFRPLMFLPQLCQPAVEYFSMPRVIARLLFVASYYIRALQTILQIFVAFNRMTCVLVPLRYEQLWKKYIYLSYLIIFILPAVAVINPAISHIYPSSYYSGMTLNYKKEIAWLSISGTTLLFNIPSVTLSAIFSTVTLLILGKNGQNLKRTERILCATSAIMTAGLLLTAGIQILNTFRDNPLVEWIPRRFVYLSTAIASDLLFAWSSLAMIILNRQLRNDILGRGSPQNQLFTTSIIQLKSV